MNLLKYAKKLLPVLAASVALSGISVGAFSTTKPLFTLGLPDRQWKSFKAEGFQTPVTGVIYHSQPSLWCGMPLGGLATGCLDIENNGTLGYCTLFSRVWGHDDGSDGKSLYRDRVWAWDYKKNDNMVIDINDPSRDKMGVPFLGLSVGDKTWVLSTQKIDGLSSASDLDYWGHYPVADIEYKTDAPVQVGLRCWSPFLPGDIYGSNVPAAVFEVHLRNTDKVAKSGKVLLSFPGPRPREISGKIDKSFVQSKDGLYQGVSVTTAGRVGYVLAAVGSKDVVTGGCLGSNSSAWAGAAKSLPTLGSDDGGTTVAVPYKLAGKSSKVVRFVLAWYSPQWQSDFYYDGVTDHSYTNMYTTRYKDARAVADYVSAKHASLLKRIISWQSVVYSDKKLPGWMKDGLVNTLHLITENGFWAASDNTIGKWCAPDGVFSLVESTVADGQQSCIPCDWYGNLPLVYFYPQLAKSTLRAYVHFMREDGAVPFDLGRGLDLITQQQYDRQRTLNGCCFVDLVDRLWQRTGDKKVLTEFYPAVKRSINYMLGLIPGDAGIISTAGDQWYEAMAWPGMSSHVGGVRLATLRLAERMAVASGDAEYAAKCNSCIDKGSNILESYLWAGTHYLIYNDEKVSDEKLRLQTDRKGQEFLANVNDGAGGKSDLLLSHQLDGQWMADVHGVKGVFEEDHVKTTLQTIKKLNDPITTAGMLVVVRPDGNATDFGGRMGGLCTMPASVFITAMNYIYDGDDKTGLQMAHDCQREMVCDQGMTWDMPNMMIGTSTKKQRVYGTDYYQCMSFWGMPAAMDKADIAKFCNHGGLIEKIIKAAR